MKRNRRIWTGWYVSAAVIVVCCQLGCNSQPYRVVPISGTVKYEDESLIPGEMIMLMFISQEAAIDRKTHPRAGRVKVNVADGTFKNVMTYEFGDGAIRGTHKVVVKAVGENESPIDAVPPEYSDASTTPLTITVGDRREFNIRIPKPG